MEQRDLYNIVAIKNIDDEDFIFSVDKERYVIPTGEIRRFPKFMARLAIKHLIDKVLQKEDPQGASLGNQAKRDEVGSKIFVVEEKFEEPKAPTAHDIVLEVNKPSDLERLLDKNKTRLKKDELLIPVPKPKIEDDKVTVTVDDEEEETFEGLKTEETKSEELPSREEMLEYAQNTLGINLRNYIEIDGQRRQIGKMYREMPLEDLYKELQMGE